MRKHVQSTGTAHANSQHNRQPRSSGTSHPDIKESQKCLAAWVQGASSPTGHSFKFVSSTQFQIACALGPHGDQKEVPRPPSGREETPLHPRTRSLRLKLLQRASDARATLADMAVETEWSALGRNSATQLLSLSRPRGHGVCDHNEFERWANILTSIPYAAVGVQTIRNHKSGGGRCYGASLVAVAAGSAIYHSSRGKYRSLGRKIDYWAIAVASTALLRASCQKVPKLATAASLLLTPFQPFAVVATNGAVIEANFFKRRHNTHELQASHRLHCAAVALGGAAFIGEEFQPKVPLIHASWHLMSAAGVAAMGPMLLHFEAHAK